MVLCFICLGLATETLQAQGFEEYRNQKLKDFADYRQRKLDEFEAYRRKKLLEFADYVARGWQPFQSEAKKVKVPEPKPVEPPVAPKEEPLPIRPIAIPQGKTMPLVVPRMEPKLKLPEIPEPKPQEDSRKTMSFFGTEVKVTLPASLRVTMRGHSETEVSRVLRMLAGDDAAALVRDVVSIYQTMNLNGWAAVQLCGQVAERMEGNGDAATVLQAYLLTTLGYDARLCESGGQLLVMAPMAGEPLLARAKIKGTFYYLLNDRSGRGGTLKTYTKNISEATRRIDFTDATKIRFSQQVTAPRTVIAVNYPSASATVQVNKNLIDFYATMPIMGQYPWTFYARQEMEPRMRQALLPPLKKATQGKSEVEAVSILMNFMHFGFKYDTDEKQFGYEKPFFFEENFYYPRNDCEDRGILFSYLVRQVLGMDAVLLYLPGHIWTAVRFSTPVGGDYVTVKGHRYTVCDPTYMGASIGMTQPPYRGKQPTVFTID